MPVPTIATLVGWPVWKSGSRAIDGSPVGRLRWPASRTAADFEVVVSLTLAY
jgi:hypothetical protein